ncbi:DUF2971 domain-containing protein [Serratia marcescens]|uniref:DUF2971 domain-containing protein n=1 Tax=Serratia marcescens TaxID=615 RepID=UPI0006664AE9|nr:DUF2971 domain-containing protein [Serratia marcescens]MBH2974015.1 DUF2971 domain-containing protein [Serratia marcescens]MBH2978686.1 DUF2971 domain-containing protein [Serratia marcescens]MBN5326359.1 DUF2971 domain-containing protein [Serratia marcescens]MBN5348750.1 DUF2971 domain-containing protein [Serratia marcescens]MDU0862548.1 DUF2971 domain-containing protein [Serratia marcescens]
MLDKRDLLGPAPSSIVTGLPIVNERHFPFNSKSIGYFDGAIGDQFSPSHNYIAYVAKGVVRNHGKPFYFHYTKLDNFKNILNSGAFWASELGKMNDAQEVTYAKDRLIDQLGIIMEKKNILLEVRKCLVEELNKFFIEDVCQGLYCVSLSKRGNLLSQWVKYSQEDGISFALNTQLIAAIPSYYKEAKCIDVIYSMKEQHSILAELANRLFSRLERVSSVEDVRKLLISEYKEELRYIVCAIKNPSFAEEEELRIIIPRDSNEEAVKVRPGGGTYLELNFMKVYNKTPTIDFLIEYAFSAPTRDEKKSLNKIYKILSHKRIKFGFLVGSGSSYIWPGTK